MKLVGELLGFFAVGVGFLAFQQKNRKRILIFKLICDVLWATHFLLLGAFSGMVLSLVAAMRAITFSVVRKNDSKKSIIWLLLFLCINVTSILLAWNSPWSVCSLISGVLATIAFWQKSPTRIKLISLPVCISQITYAIAMGSYASSLNELITASSIAIFFIRGAISKKKIDTEERS